MSARLIPLPPGGGGDPRLDGLANASAFVSIAQEEIRQAIDLAQLVEVLKALRTLEVEADTRRLILIARSTERQDDAVLDTTQASRVIGRSVDWCNRHRREMAPALVSATGPRPRYSRNRLMELLGKWNREGRR